MTDRPNILLVVMDTARRDAFTPYGAPPDATPAIAQLASMGTAVATAVAGSNWTMPSHASMLTGLLPRSAGLSSTPAQDNDNIALVLAQHRQRYLPSVFRDAGYATFGASANVWISERNGFSMGFDEWHDVVTRRVHRMHDGRLRGKAKWYLQALQAQLDDGMSEIEAHIERWLAKRDGRPWLYFVNLIECHSPYLPPKPFSDVGPIKRLLAARDARRWQTLPGVWACCAGGASPSARSLERMHHLYERSVRMMDAWTGRIMEKLDKAKVLDDTIVVVTSDHGENFGEGGFIGHSVSLDDRLITVPFVMAGPGTPSIDGAWSQARMPSLIARAAGLADAPWSDDDVPSGPPVSQYDTGITRDAPRFDVFHEWGATEEGIRRFIEPGTCATDGRYKLVRLGREERFFDLANDPLELSPIGIQTAPNDVVSTLRQSMDEAAKSEWIPDVASLKGAKRTTTEEEDQELEERMKLLGYM